MSITRVKDLKTAKKIVRNEEDSSALLDRNDPLIAIALLENVGKRIELDKIFTYWENHEGKSVPGSAVRQTLELATSEMSYEETIKFLLHKNAAGSIPKYTGPFLLKKMVTDPDFSAALQQDNVLAPILFQINPEAAAMMPNGFVKPLGAASKAFLREDKILNSGFDPNHMTPFEEDVIAIQTLLADEESMLRQLDSLEAELNATLKTLNPAIQLPLKPFLESDHRLFTKPYSKHPDQSFLFDFFKAWATKNGFFGMTRLTNEQSNQQFVQNLINAIQFKDNEFDGTFHGAWTHLIQWYCIVNAYNNGQLHLYHSPATLYQEIGKNADEENKIWNVTFETVVSKIKNSRDFRDVASFHNFLIKDPMFAQRCPAIQSMLYARALKADEKQNTATKFKI